MNTVDILKAAKQLLIDKGWTQEAFARDNEGTKVRAYNETATCFCGVGALRAVGAKGGTPLYVAEAALTRAAVGEDSFDYFFDFNDAPGRTVDEVLAVFDKAIAAEEARVAPQQ